jgi:hypothetical protein
MIRRVVKSECEFEAACETRLAKRRRFQAGAVLNVLQWVRPDAARFTVEGEGIEVWCCPKTIFDEGTESPEASAAPVAG